MRVGVFRDIEILLEFAPGVREKRPVSADAGAEFICLEQVVGRARHETAVAHPHLAVQLQEPFVLPPLFWTETSAGEHQYQRIGSLQLREREMLAAMVRKLVVGKGRAGSDVGSHSTLLLFSFPNPRNARSSGAQSKLGIHAISRTFARRHRLIGTLTS